MSHSIFVSSPSPKSLELSFLCLRLSEAGTNGLTGIDAGAVLGEAKDLDWVGGAQGPNLGLQGLPARPNPPVPLSSDRGPDPVSPDPVASRSHAFRALLCPLVGLCQVPLPRPVSLRFSGGSWDSPLIHRLAFSGRIDFSPSSGSLLTLAAAPEVSMRVSHLGRLTSLCVFSTPPRPSDVSGCRVSAADSASLGLFSAFLSAPLRISPSVPRCPASLCLSPTLRHSGVVLYLCVSGRRCLSPSLGVREPVNLKPPSFCRVCLPRYRSLSRLCV